MDHTKLDPVAVRIELPQPSTTEVIGAVGTTKGAAVIEDGVLVQPDTDCVTVYVPAVVTVIEFVVSPVDHSKLDPTAVITELPQLFEIVKLGLAGAETSDKAVLRLFERHPLLYEIEYEPANNPEIVYGHELLEIEPGVGPVHVITPVPEPLITIEPSFNPHADGLVNVPKPITGEIKGLAKPDAGKLVHEPIVCVTV